MLKKIYLKCAKKCFFYKHMNIVTKNGGKKRELKIFAETHRFLKQTTMEKNRQEKVRKHVFYKHTNIVIKNGGKKTREKIFPKIHD